MSIFKHRLVGLALVASVGISTSPALMADPPFQHDSSGSVTPVWDTTTDFSNDRSYFQLPQIALSPDGLRAYAVRGGGSVNGITAAFDVNDGSQIWFQNVPWNMRAVEASEDDEVVVFGEDGSSAFILAFDGPTGDLLWRNDLATALASQPNLQGFELHRASGQTAAIWRVGSDPLAFALLDVASGQEQWRIQLAPGADRRIGGVRDVEFSPDGLTIYVLTEIEDISQQSPGATIFSVSAHSAASGSNLWQREWRNGYQDGETFRLVGHSPPNALAVSPDGQMVVAVGGTREICFDFFGDGYGGESQILAIAYTADGSELWTYRPEATGGDPAETACEAGDDQAHDVAISSKGYVAITGVSLPEGELNSSARDVYTVALDLDTGDPLWDQRGPRHGGTADSNVQFTADERTVVISASLRFTPAQFGCTAFRNHSAAFGLTADSGSELWRDIWAPDCLFGSSYYKGAVIVPSDDRFIGLTYDSFRQRLTALDFQGPPPEICDNGVDDDNDGFIDSEDPDCSASEIDPIPLVRCLHDPIYSNTVGEPTTIIAEAFDQEGLPLEVGALEIWLDDNEAAPRLIATNTQVSEVQFTPQGPFGYRCVAKDGTQVASSGWRRSVVGNFDFPAIPVVINGPLYEKIDIVFIADQDEYGSFSDPSFLADVRSLINEGYWTIPWFLDNQAAFNFWIAKSQGRGGPNPDRENPDGGDDFFCFREPPADWGAFHLFADAGGIVHRSACRDNAGGGLFSVEMEIDRLQVVAHESGHAPFGMPDEYQGAGRYYVITPASTLFATEPECLVAATARGFDPVCRPLVDRDETMTMWLFEEDYRSLQPRPRDLMQGTGCFSLNQASNRCTVVAATKSGPEPDPNGVVPCERTDSTYRGDPDGTPNGDDTYWICRGKGDAASAVWASFDGDAVRYDVGLSETDRMFWFLQQCNGGNC